MIAAQNYLTGIFFGGMMATKGKTKKAAKAVTSKVVSNGGAHVPSLGEIGLDQFTPYIFNRIAARWNADLIPLLREKDLTTVHMRTLAVLSVNDCISVNELSVLTVTEQSTLSRSLDSMEKMGLVERRSRESDARFIEIHITQRGRDRFNQFWPLMYDHYQKMLSDIDGAELEQFLSTLRKILSNIKKQPY